MNPKTCAVIPVYNHGDRVGEVVGAAVAMGIHCILVDDGSDGRTHGILERLASNGPGVTLVTRPRNGGKGAAVKTGLAEASRLGYGHALQIDADGQHETADIPRMLEAADLDPEAVILGSPAFDASAPKGRLWGRRISRFWIHLETLSREIDDGLCGFRCYPLAQTCAVLDRSPTGDRMDFDPEILVRLHWAGLHFVNIPTRVRYHGGGLSHYRLFRDNLHLSAMYFRLFWGAIARLPRLAGRARRRRQARKASAQWLEVSERGASWGPRLTLALYNLLGHRLSTILLQPVLAYFFATDRRGRRVSAAYFRRVARHCGDYKGERARPRLRHSYRQYHEFGTTLLDRFAIWQGRLDRFEVTWEGWNHLLALLDRGKAGLLVSAHLGSVELLRALARKDPRLRVRVLLFEQNAQRINATFRRINPDVGTDVVALESISVPTAIELREAIGRGEFIGLLGDRISAGARNRITRVPFLGSDAPFPQGPWVLASLLECPVFLVYGIRTGPRAYHFIAEPFAEHIELPRRTREEALTRIVGDYAARLGTMVCRYPYQWYNFYDFWGELAP